jgi:3-oxoacyl-[acyl-carrier-protein] synthase-3
MDGPEVFRHAVTKISEVIGTILDQAGYKASDIDWFVPHQANKRILDGAAKKLGLDKNRIIITLDKHANTSAASIPLALNTARADGRIKTGDLVLLEAMGGGFTWGAVLLRW